MLPDHENVIKCKEDAIQMFCNTIHFDHTPDKIAPNTSNCTKIIGA